jgi:dCTP diphosphatase
MNIRQIQDQLAAFAAERDWDRFHSPKNLCMALSAEAGELTDHFQWVTEQESACLAPEHRQAAAYELADVFIYALRLADKLGIDLEDTVQRKMKLNAEKYPAAR